MDSPKDIYHKEQMPWLARRRRRSSFEQPRVAAPPSESALRHVPSEPGQGRRRRRRHRDTQREASRFNRMVWVGITLVVLAYLSVLVGSIVLHRLRGHFKRAPVPVAAPVKKAPVAPVAPAAAMAPEDEIPLANRIQNWRRGLKLLEEARTMMAGGRTETARARLQESAALVPHAVDQALELARVHFEEQNFPEAERLLLQVVAADPGRADARVLLARTLLARQRNEEALALAEWVVDVDPYSEKGHDVAAQAALALNRLSVAIGHLRKLANLNLDNLAAQNNLGVAYLRNGELALARSTFEGVVRGDAQNTMGHYNLAVCLTRLGQPEEAAEALSRAAVVFGAPFVSAWLQSPDFEALRGNAAVEALKKQWAAPVEALQPAAAPGG